MESKRKTLDMFVKPGLTLIYSSFCFFSGYLLPFYFYWCCIDLFVPLLQHVGCTEMVSDKTGIDLLIEIMSSKLTWWDFLSEQTPTGWESPGELPMKYLLQSNLLLQLIRELYLSHLLIKFSHSLFWHKLLEKATSSQFLIQNCLVCGLRQHSWAPRLWDMSVMCSALSCCLVCCSAMLHSM